MKLSTLSITAVLSLACASTFASEVVFKAANNNIATQACVLAATDGMDAAKTLVEANDINFNLFKATVSCNELSLTKFAKTYAKQDIVESNEQSDKTEVVKLVAKTQTVESQLCMDAVFMGVDRARAKHNINGSVICNNQPLSRFVSKFKNKEVRLAAAED